MIDKIGRLPLRPAGQESRKTGRKVSAEDFYKVVGDAVREFVYSVNSSVKEADENIKAFMRNEIDVHTLMISLERARLLLSLFLELENRVIEAYREIMRAPM